MPKRVNQPKKIKRQKKHGFMHRMATADGRNIIKRRMLRGRKVLSA